MRQRGIIIVLAIFFGLAAAFMVTSYANRAKERALAKAKTVSVLTAAQEVPLGLTLDELRQRRLVKAKKVPREFVAEGAIRSKKRLGNKVLAVGLSPGEQLTTGKFKVSKEAGLAFTVPENMVAVAIPIDDMKAAGNLIKVGDYVNIVGTTKRADDEEFTKTILQKVHVLAVGSNLENPDASQRSAASRVSSSSSGAKTSRTVTLALSQVDSEKLIFMQDQGRIWLTLLPSKKAQAVTTDGQTVETVFK